MSQDQPAQRQKFIESSAEFLDAMANANRLAILTILVETETSVGQLCEQIGLSQSALSQHLSRLRYAGLVVFRRDAQTVYYRCDSTSVKSVLELLANVVSTEKSPLPEAA